MYLQKELTNVYWDLADALVIMKADFKPNGDGTSTATWNLSLFKDISSVTMQNSDNFTYSYLLTKEELDWTTTTVLYNKIVESIIVDWEETNLLHGNIWTVGFQDAIIVV